MARQARRLTARQVQTAVTPGRLADGGNLYLQITPSGSRSWVFLYRRNGRQRELGLGSLSAVSLAEARVRAAKARSLLANGEDPVEARQLTRKAGITFGAVADEVIESLQAGFRNQKHRDQWATSLGKVAYDRERVRIDPRLHEEHVEALTKLRATPIANLSVEHVLAVLKPIWLEAPETASRLRGRIERVLDVARVRSLREGDNPARWRGHLSALLPRHSKQQQRHHAAIPYVDLPGFVARLRTAGGISSRALEFLILTAARSGEVLGMRWSEVDLAARLWTVPGERMKAGRQHEVPLSPRALAILAEMAILATGPDSFVFPGQKPGKGLSSMSLEMAMRRLGSSATPHGCRSSFRDWCGEETAFPREVAEAALAHVIANKVEAAYRRGSALEKRRVMMNTWAEWCEPKAWPSGMLDDLASPSRPEPQFHDR